MVSPISPTSDTLFTAFGTPITLTKVKEWASQFFLILAYAFPYATVFAIAFSYPPIGSLYLAVIGSISSMVSFILSTLIAPNPPIPIAASSTPFIPSTAFIPSIKKDEEIQVQIPRGMLQDITVSLLDGTAYAERASKIPSWEGNPLGLNNPSCNCCFNASLQVLMSTPEATKHLHKYLVALVQTFEQKSKEGKPEEKNHHIFSHLRVLSENALLQLETYLKERHQNGRNISACDTQAFRVLLAALHPGSDFKPSSFAQMDATEILTALLEPFHFPPPDAFRIPTVKTTQVKPLLTVEGSVKATKGDYIRLDANLQFKTKESSSLIPLNFPDTQTALLATTQVPFNDLWQHFLENSGNQDEPLTAQAPTDTSPISYQTAKVTHTLDGTPKFLTLSFKRHAFDNGEAKKLQASITAIPLSLPHPTDTSVTYELISAITQVGGASCGHYIAYVKGQDGNWYVLNDSVKTPLSESELSKQIKDAYLLQYRALEKTS